MAMDWTKIVKPISESSVFKSGSNATAKKTPAERVASKMDEALAAFKAGNKDVKRATIVEKDGQVKFSIRYANTALALVGTTTVFFVPADQLDAVFAAIKADVLEGKFNNQLAVLEAKVMERGQALSKSKKDKAKAS